MGCGAFRERGAGTSSAAGRYRRAKQSPRGDEQAQSAELAAGQQPGQHGQDRPVRPRQPRTLGLAPEHVHLMAQNQDQLQAYDDMRVSSKL
jgi:hypothetical protein